MPARDDSANDDIKALIRTIPDFPKPGIRFRDITTLLLDGPGFARATERLAALHPGPIDIVAAIEARGFLFGAAVAYARGVGLALIRKDGKLPGATVAVDYALEYGEDRIAMHQDALIPGARVLLIDDLIATGGTALAAARLIAKAGGAVAGAAFVVDLPDLGGAARLRAEGIDTRALVEFEGD